MIQIDFANNASKIVKENSAVIGLAAAGSWLTNELDEFSDLDLVLVTKEKISSDKLKMLDFANSFGQLLTAFTGEHVGEPRLLICLYDNPLLHVDIKFVTLDEFSARIETPVILCDTNGQLQLAIEQSTARFPYPDYQWMEDRFWIWVHYALLKIGRGEYMEAFDFLGYVRMVVLGPLLHIKNGNLPKGVRKVETTLADDDFLQLKQTLPMYDRASLLNSLQRAVLLYKELRTNLFTGNINLHHVTEEKVMRFFADIRERS